MIKSNKDNFKKLILSLIRFEFSIDILISKISKLDFNDDITIKLEVKDIKYALNLFLTKKITASSLKKWAEFIELNENIEYQENENDKIANIIFYLANPSINGKINKKVVEGLLNNC